MTLLIVLVAWMRLSLYEGAYGFTMLRLYSHIFAGWVAVVFVLLAADLAGLVPQPALVRRRDHTDGAEPVAGSQPGQP